MVVLSWIWRKLYQRGTGTNSLPLSGVSSQSLSKVFLAFLLHKKRRQDSSIGFGAPVRANMRAGGISSAQVTSSLLESVSSVLLFDLMALS